jgi:hypothetical protein
MNNYVTIIFQIIILIFAFNNLSIAQNSGFDKVLVLEATLEKSKFYPATPVELSLTIKNETDFTINIFDTEPLRGFDILIKDANGVILPLTKEGKKKKYPNIIMGRSGAYIEANKELKLRKIILNDLFSLNKIGEYTVEVKQSYYFQDIFDKDTGMEKVGILTSNVKFNIK